MSVMTTAIINGYFDVAKFLLDHGADPNLAATGGLAPLFATIDQAWAARTWYPAASSEQQQIRHLDLMKALLAHGANPNAKMGPKLWFRTFHGTWSVPNVPPPSCAAAQQKKLTPFRLLGFRGPIQRFPPPHGVSRLKVLP